MAHEYDDEEPMGLTEDFDVKDGWELDKDLSIEGSTSIFGKLTSADGRDILVLTPGYTLVDYDNVKNVKLVDLNTNEIKTLEIPEQDKYFLTGYTFTFNTKEYLVLNTGHNFVVWDLNGGVEPLCERKIPFYQVMLVFYEREGVMYYQ